MNDLIYRIFCPHTSQSAVISTISFALKDPPNDPSLLSIPAALEQGALGRACQGPHWCPGSLCSTPSPWGQQGDAADSPPPPQPRGRGCVPTRTSGPFRLTALWGCPGPISAPLVGSSWGSHLLTEHCPAAPCPVGRGLRSGAKQSSPASAEPASHVALYPGMLLQREMQGAAPARHSQSGLSILMW